MRIGDQEHGLGESVQEREVIANRCPHDGIVNRPPSVDHAIAHGDEIVPRERVLRAHYGYFMKQAKQPGATGVAEAPDRFEDGGGAESERVPHDVGRRIDVVGSTIGLQRNRAGESLAESDPVRGDGRDVDLDTGQIVRHLRGSGST